MVQPARLRGHVVEERGEVVCMVDVAAGHARTSLGLEIRRAGSRSGPLTRRVRVRLTGGGRRSVGWRDASAEAVALGGRGPTYGPVLKWFNRLVSEDVSLRSPGRSELGASRSAERSGLGARARRLRATMATYASERMLGYPRNEAKPSAYLYLCFLSKLAGEDGFPVSRETRISRHRRPPAGAEDLGRFDQLVRTQRQAQADIRPPGLADAVKIVAGPAGLRSPESKDPSGSAGLMGKGNQDLIGPAGLIGKRCRDETSRARG